MSPSKSTSGPDRLYVGDNDLAVADGKTSTIDFSLNGGAARAKFKKARIEARATDQQNGPQVRPACHADGTVYLAYMGWRSSTGDWKANTLIVTADLVVVRDDKGGNSPKAFQDLLGVPIPDPAPKSHLITFCGEMPRERGARVLATSQL